MIIDNQSLNIMKELLEILDKKSEDETINENEEGMRDILMGVVSNEYAYIREILQDYKG